MSELKTKSTLWKPWQNPVFNRFRRSRLRIRKSIFWFLLTFIVTTFVVSLTYIIMTKSGSANPQEAARNLFLPLLIIQGVILLMKGTGSVSAGIIQDKIDQTLDYQKLTPLPPLSNIAGYLFGLPILEYAMFALTLPHLLFIIIVGHISLDVVLGVYLVFFSTAILYHMTGFAAGMVMKRWIWGYLLSFFMVGMINVILPLFVSQIGLKFFQYLSIWPTISQKLLPLYMNVLEIQNIQNPFLAAGGDVPFFWWKFTPFAFTMMIQVMLSSTFIVMVRRKWMDANRHALGKGYALAIMGGFILVLIGNIWPILNRDYLPFQLFGVSNLEEIEQPVAIALPLIFSYMMWLLAFLLIGIVVPSHSSVMRGVRRARRRGLKHAKAWEDDSGNIGFTGLFAVIALVGYGVMYFISQNAGYFDFLKEAGVLHWQLPLVLGLVIFNTVLLVQYLELKSTVLVVLLQWFLPVLVAIISAAARSNVGYFESCLASVSPIALLAMSGLSPAQHFMRAEEVGHLEVLNVGVNFGLLVIMLQTAWLCWRWWKASSVLTGPMQSVTADR